MPCLPLIFAVFFPRLVMILMAIFTNWFSRAFNTALWPFLGFLFLPYTTLAYMTAMLNNNHAVSGGWLALIVVAALIDLLGHRHSLRTRSWKRSR